LCAAIQRLVDQHLHAFEHPAKAQGYAAGWAVDFKGQVRGEHVDRRQVLRGIDQ